MWITFQERKWIRVWHVRGDLPGNWRELQKRAWREGAPLDALYVDYAGRWICARDLAADHWIHAALASDREHCRRGFWRAAAAKRSRTRNYMLREFSVSLRTEIWVP